MGGEALSGADVLSRAGQAHHNGVIGLGGHVPCHGLPVGAEGVVEVLLQQLPVHPIALVAGDGHLGHIPVDVDIVPIGVGHPVAGDRPLLHGGGACKGDGGVGLQGVEVDGVGAQVGVILDGVLRDVGVAGQGMLVDGHPGVDDSLCQLIPVLPEPRGLVVLQRVFGVSRLGIRVQPVAGVVHRSLKGVAGGRARRVGVELDDQLLPILAHQPPDAGKLAVVGLPVLLDIQGVVVFDDLVGAVDPATGPDLAEGEDIVAA